MSNFKIAHANLKDPSISSLRMNHFKIAHISTWLATHTNGKNSLKICAVVHVIDTMARTPLGPCKLVWDRVVQANE